MLINGKNRGMLYTVGASLEIAKLLPGNNFSRISEISDDEVKLDSFIIDTAIILNRSYEQKKQLENPSYEPDIITKEEFLWLDMSEFKRVSSEVFKCLNSDSEQTIETKETKKKLKKKE